MAVPKSVTGTTRLSYGIAEAAEILGVSRAFIRKLIRLGKLDVRHIGRRVLVRADELAHLLDADAEL